MKESICGKSCSTCSKKSEFGCTGCLNTRGFASISSTKTCPIALCAYNKGTDCESCYACGTGYGCETYKNRDNMAQVRADRIVSRRREAKKLSNSFALLIISIALNILASLLGSSAFPDAAQKTGQVMDIAGTVCQLIAMICFFTHSEYYKKALGFFLAEIVVSFLYGFTGSLLLGIVLIVVSILSTKALFDAHSDATSLIDRDVSMRWENLSVFYVTIYTLIAASPILIAVLGFLGIILATLLILVLSILLIVASVRYIILCVKTRHACERYANFNMGE